jgi:putative transposase
MKNWYTAKELVGKPGMPNTTRGVKARAARENWAGQRRSRSKAVEYLIDILPEETITALIAEQSNSRLGPSNTEENLLNQGTSVSASATELNDAQRSTMSARLALVLEIERKMSFVTQKQAIAAVVVLSREHNLDRFLQDRVLVANDRSKPTSILSERTLKRWLGVYRAHGELGLAPNRRKMNLAMPSWGADFLRCYQRPTKPSVEASYAEFCGKYLADQPSIHQVRRFLDKISPEARNTGRHSVQELKALQPFKRRTTEDLAPCDVYTADGHRFDAEIVNPRTGKPYRPELTVVIDVATRRIVGVSIGEAECTVSVIDALRNAVQHGMFALFYVDNGSGFANDTVREVVDRLGGTLTHALPYNSQARGLIERSHQTVWINAAKKLTSYIGKDMDKHAGSKTFRISRKQLRENGSSSLIPSFEIFMAGVQYEIEVYNNSPHRSLAKVRDPMTGKRRHLSPIEAWTKAIATGWQPIIAPMEILDDVIRPQVIRPTRRGEVSWAGNKYFLDSLRDLHGTDVRVSYDARDASRVWIRNLNGVLIGEALLDGNATPYMPKSMVERAQEKREHGQLKRTIEKFKNLTESKNQANEMEYILTPTLDAEQLAEARRIAASLTVPLPDSFKVPTDPISRYRLWQTLDDRIRKDTTLSRDEADWHSEYQADIEINAMIRMFSHTNT